MTKINSVNKPQPGDQLKVTINNLSFFGGRGVARHEGFVIFVDSVLPNEEALIQIETVKSSYAEATLLEVLSPSPKRRTPPCLLAKECGGCTWQHIPYDHQLELKFSLFEYELKKLKSFSPGKLFPIAPSPTEFFYRNRVQVQIQSQIQGQDESTPRWGFFQKRSHQFISVKKCWLMDERIQKYLDENLLAMSDVQPSHSESRKKMQKWSQASYPRRIELFLDVKGQVQTHIQNTSEGFSQVNTLMNEKLIETLLSQLGEQSFDSIFDFYCGSGNFTFPLAQKFPKAQVIGVEFSRASIKIAKEKLKILSNPLSNTFPDEHPNIQFYCQKVEDFSLEPSLKTPGTSSKNLVLLDPPRSGIEKNFLKKITPQWVSQLVYISCNPSTFIRDAQKLEEQGFELQSSFPMDMFPQTDHLESLNFFLPK